MKQRLLTCFAIIIFLSTCKDDVTERSSQAEKYLNVLLDIMQQNSINRYKINWVDFRAKVLASVPSAQSIQEIYPAIKEALIMLGDNHSFFVKPDGNFIVPGTLSCDAQTIGNPTLPDNVGYVRIKEFSGSVNAALAYARDIQDQIKSQDSDNLLGWVVDLRSNLGGNMWPMIAGIGPILGEGIAGYFIDADGNELPWSYLNGSSILDGNIITSFGNSYELTIPNPKVAVLLDNGVASSGEVIAISFIGRDNSKSFGIPTCGATTSNQSFNLSDNAVLFLTTSYLADRDKNLFGTPITPDIITDNDKIIQEALDWIQN
jgi:hypothetical protein